MPYVEDIQRLSLFIVYLWPANKSKAVALRILRHDNIIIAGGTVDDCKRTRIVLHDDANMLPAGVEHQVTGLSTAPRDIIAIAVLV